jgi:hypothetical protein
MNINTSLDQSILDKIDTIQEKTHQDIKQIIQTAIELYYQQIQHPEKDPLSVLKQSKFIGCGESDPELSSNYKAQLKTILNDSL